MFFSITDRFSSSLRPFIEKMFARKNDSHNNKSTDPLILYFALFEGVE